jgi:hypothetical protein
MQHHAASAWHPETSHPVGRRLVWMFAGGRGELMSYIYSGQPIANLGDLSEKAAAAVTLEQSALDPEQAVAPGFVFAKVGRSATGEPIVHGPGHREVPVISIAADEASNDVDQSMQMRMDRTEDAMPPAQVAPDDHAVGILVRQDILLFYPVIAVDTEVEVESYQEGSATTDDLIHELPFQS